MISISCKKHPKYKGKRQPKMDGCEACWIIWGVVYDSKHIIGIPLKVKHR